jgi:hypothetical protein
LFSVESDVEEYMHVEVTPPIEKTPGKVKNPLVEPAILHDTIL